MSPIKLHARDPKNRSKKLCACGGHSIKAKNAKRNKQRRIKLSSKLCISLMPKLDANATLKIVELTKSKPAAFDKSYDEWGKNNELVYG